MQIEEEIEEITEYISDKEEGCNAEDEASKSPTTTRTLTKSGPWLSKDPSMQSVECILAELNTELQRESAVPFPEFGVDIILHHKDFSELEEEDEDSSSSSSEESENQYRKYLAFFGLFLHMLILFGERFLFRLHFFLLKGNIENFFFGYAMHLHLTSFFFGLLKQAICFPFVLTFFVLQ